MGAELLHAFLTRHCFITYKCRTKELTTPALPYAENVAPKKRSEITRLPQVHPHPLFGRMLKAARLKPRPKPRPKRRPRRRPLLRPRLKLRPKKRSRPERRRLQRPRCGR